MPPPLSNPPPFLSPSNIILTLLLTLTSLFLSPCYSIDVQVQALLAWKANLNSSTDVLKSWNPSAQTPCKWFGVSCNPNGDVTNITLKSVEIQGPLPSNFQPLTSLNTLILSSANLTGPIPKEFGDYSELVTLDISSNSITGEIPVEVCNLMKLQTLALNTNFLEGEIPSEIGNLSSLVSFTVYDNQLTGGIPKEIGNLGNLQTFRAGGNQNLKGEIPMEIGNCTNLTMLGLAETGISGNLPASIGMLKNLQTLAIYTALLSGPIPDEIGNCSALQNLYLYQNSISGQIPASIGRLKNLQSLLLWQNTIVGTIPSELGNCRELTVVDLSENQLVGEIPTSIGLLSLLEEFQLSVNQLSGTIPTELSNCTALTQLELDNNNFSGEIPSSVFGKLNSLTLFFAWHNNLTGQIPESLSQCENLQALDLSYNNLFGPIPKQIFGLKNLTKLLLLSNDLSGFIPPDVGNCTSLYRFRVNQNRLAGTIPLEIGNLKSLNFLDMGNNMFVGQIPPLSGCGNLEYLDLHSNGLASFLPDSLPKSLQYIDLSDNRLTGQLSPSVGSLTALTKLNLGKNQLSGGIPGEILSCSQLQFIDLGNNGFSGEIPKELGQIPALEISLNLSCNLFTGDIPSEFSGLTKLGILDLSHNNLTGNLDTLTSLQNLVSLNVSFNNLSGELPNTPFFRNLPMSDLTGNQALYIPGANTPADRIGSAGRTKTMLKLVMTILVSASAVLVLLTVYMLVQARLAKSGSLESESWELTLYQKMEFSTDDIVRNLVSSNVIGTGSSGVVYRVTIPSGQTLAVKKMWSSEESGAFTSEIQTLGSIRHRNIVRLLGWGSNPTLKLLFYDYHPNGSLSSLLHGGLGAGKGGGAEWETRYDIVLGVAHALDYLHHDCMPPILHGDVKAMNVLLGPHFEPFLADFGLARLVNGGAGGSDDSSKNSLKPSLAGSYGYMAPELASMQPTTEKSDVYSYGVVLLEVLTGRHPLDPTLPGGAHLVQWVRDHLQSKGDPADILDPKLRGMANPHMHEMLQTLAVSLLCISTRATDRPTMKDVVAMLKEIRHVAPTNRSESDLLKAGSLASLQPSPPSRNMVYQGSSNCSFAFSDESSV